MYPLIKRLNIDVVREIYSYNNFSKLDLEWFKFLHKEALTRVLKDLKIVSHLRSMFCNATYVLTATDTRPLLLSIESAEYLRT